MTPRGYDRSGLQVALRVLAGSALVCLNLATALAQTTASNLEGVVSDGTGAALPGSVVTITRKQTGSERVVVTDDAGRYRAPALEPGMYSIAAELVGFQTTSHDDVRLAVGQTLTVNFRLGLGELTETVVVTGQSPLFETTRSSVSAIVEEAQIRDLPLNGRDFSQLTLLQPGVIASPTTTRQLDRGMGTQVSIAGARPNQISYQLDGTDVNFQGNGSPGSAAGGLLGVETVQEFQILLNNYGAEYGRSTGGIVSAVTRSGTNVYHGSILVFGRDDMFDARNFFDPPDAKSPPLSRHQFGGYLGGPILRDRTFFFGSYEGLRQDRGRTSIAQVPSRATRSRTDIHPSARPYVLLYPEPNRPDTGSTGQYVVEVVEPTREDYAVGKIDHRFAAGQEASVRYSWDRATVTVPQALPLFSTQSNTKAEFLVGQHKWAILPGLLNSFTVAWNRAFEETVNLNSGHVDQSLYFVPGTQFGSLEVSGLSLLGPDTNTPTFVDLKSLQIVEHLHWAPGSHNVKLGMNVTRWFNDQDSSFVWGGSYGFDSVEDFVLGKASSFEGQKPGSSTDRRWRQNLMGLFVQDDWSLSNRLTLNAGVRYEFITVPREQEGRSASFPDVEHGTMPVVGPLFRNPSLGNIAPRLGMAWDLAGAGRDTLSGGLGLFHEPILGNAYRAYGNRTPPFYELINPQNPTFPAPTSPGVAPLLRLDLFEFEPENPYRLQYNLTYQRALARRTFVTIGFVGSRGFHQIRNIEANQSVPVVQPDGRYFFPTRARRNPLFGSIRLRTTDGRSWYQGLILGATRRFGDDLALQASYTLGKSEDYGSQAIGSGDFENTFQPAYGLDPASNFGLSDFDVRHNFVLSYSWQIPVAPHLDGFASAIADGWQLAGILTLRSGIPFSPVIGFDRARAAPRSGGAGQRPNLAPGADPNPVLGGPDRYFDPFAFTLPDAGYLGDLPRNTITGPGFASWDGAVFKNVQLGTNARLQIRVEAFNLLNRTNFGLPAATVFNSAGRLPNAGRITATAGPARQLQFGGKVQF